jgi:hypothetical protein
MYSPQRGLVAVGRRTADEVEPRSGSWKRRYATNAFTTSCWALFGAMRPTNSQSAPPRARAVEPLDERGVGGPVERTDVEHDREHIGAPAAQIAQLAGVERRVGEPEIRARREGRELSAVRGAIGRRPVAPTA